ncbi:hypothetical protein [Reichenbachiella faecimaris]|nr:hypothetical protein [Reichenbachiella faecimaris]
MKNKKIDIESLDRKNIHQVPDGYFDGLPLKIQSRINQKNGVSSVFFITRMQMVWSATAVIALFFIGWFWYPQGTELSTTEQILADLNSEDLIEYLYEEDISTDEIIAAINENYLLDEISLIEDVIIDENLSEEDLESIYSELDYSTEIM